MNDSQVNILDFITHLIGFKKTTELYIQQYVLNLYYFYCFNTKLIKNQMKFTIYFYIIKFVYFQVHQNQILIYNKNI